MSTKMGFQGKFYLASAILSDALAATVAAATWTEVSTVQSVTLSPSANDVDVTTRANNGFKQYAVALLDAGVDITIPWNLSDASLLAMKTAFYARSAVGVAIMDGTITTTGSNGLAGNFVVTKFERGEPIDGQMVASITLKPFSCTSDYTK